MTDQTQSTVLVTGGSGFLANWCIVELLNRGYSVRTTLRNPSRQDEVRTAVGREIDPGDRLAFYTADLMGDDGWSDAVAGCDYVLHVASPFPPTQPDDADELIVPAREGTLRVLRASLNAGAKRVVVTSSVAAIDRARGDAPDKVLDEQDWANPKSKYLSPYARSKTIAEQAAWQLVDDRDERERLAVVNPGAILGPILSPDSSYSISLVSRLLKGEPAAPKLGYGLVDVRDIAALEIAAMLQPEAGGKRFIGVSEFAWMSQIAKILRSQLGDDAKRVPRFEAPNFLVKTMARFDPSIKPIVSQLGLKTIYSADRAKQQLGWSPRPVDETVVDCARSLIATNS